MRRRSLEKACSAPWSVLVILLWPLSYPQSASAATFRWYCELSREEKQLYAQNPHTGEVVSVHNGGIDFETATTSEGDNVGRDRSRHLLGSGLKQGGEYNDAIPVLQTENNGGISRRNLLDETTVAGGIPEEWYVFEARRCSCAANKRSSDPYHGIDYVCPIEFAECGIPPWWIAEDLTPGCLTRNVRVAWIRSLWPIVLVWYTLLISCLFCTNVGKHIFGFCVDRCFYQRWNEMTARRMLRQRPPIGARRLIRRHIRRQRQEFERINRVQQQALLLGIGQVEDEEHVGDDELPSDASFVAGRPENPDDLLDQRRDNKNSNRRPNELVLKTRIYRDAETDERSVKSMKSAKSFFSFDDEEEGRMSCAICFAPIVDGERVGNLTSCDHMFHVECLKTWLVRRNVCPLCNTENAAQPRYNSRRTNEPDEGGDEEHGSTSVDANEDDHQALNDVSSDSLFVIGSEYDEDEALPDPAESARILAMTIGIRNRAASERVVTL